MLMKQKPVSLRVTVLHEELGLSLTVSLRVTVLRGELGLSLAVRPCLRKLHGWCSTGPVFDLTEQQAHEGG